MDMIVLGRTNDEKGTQLEELTERILSDLGYTDLRSNVVGSGASELDVTGVFALPTPGAGTTIHLIAECKAKKDPVSMEDWLKLMGKLHVAKSERPNQVNAILVALNGYNGNVAGAYEAYRFRAQDMELIGRSEIESAAKRLFGVAELAVAEANVRRFTATALRGSEMLYFKGEIYWMFEFTDSRIALMEASGSPVEMEKAESLHELVVNAVGPRELVNLNIESLALERRIFLAKVHISILFLVGGMATEDELFSDVDFSVLEHRESLEFGIESGFILREEGSLALRFVATEGSHSYFKDVFFFVMNHKVPRSYFNLLLSSDLLDRTINADFVRYVCGIQGDIPVPEDKLEATTRLLRISPSAIAYALTPQQYFLQHRGEDDALRKQVDADDFQSFLNTLLSSFASDFVNPALNAFFYGNIGVEELEHNESIIVKGNRGILFQETLSARHRIVPFSHEGFEALMLVGCIEGGPEPWECDPDASDRMRVSEFERETERKLILYPRAKLSSRIHSAEVP